MALGRVFACSAATLLIDALEVAKDAVDFRVQAPRLVASTLPLDAHVGGLARALRRAGVAGEHGDFGQSVASILVASIFGANPTISTHSTPLPTLRPTN